MIDAQADAATNSLVSSMRSVRHGMTCTGTLRQRLGQAHRAGYTRWVCGSDAFSAASARYSAPMLR